MKSLTSVVAIAILGLPLAVAAQEKPPSADAAVSTTPPAPGGGSASPPPAAPVSPLVGTWVGHWESARKGGLTVVFVTEKTGTLVATGHGSLGSDPKPLTDVLHDGASVRFKAGFDVRTRLAADGKTLTGEGWYKGTKYDIVLTKK